eukprot:CAMPEP_0171355260 /NCGR_PEP_ID=MMETSP0878-20121228/45131_1 /TAXON_ID=67004 /ORGANISM="Thalassiosira weissflogii, Strain CCMP1336" /LENGTH=664 /DNA_ID=CAMNT_0011861257 /DNA_START=29 /DNA_END=2023 /DNA_ORIENTATION=-
MKGSLGAPNTPSTPVPRHGAGVGASGVGSVNMKTTATHCPIHVHPQRLQRRASNKAELSSALALLVGESALNQACAMLMAHSEALFGDENDTKNIIRQEGREGDENEKSRGPSAKKIRNESLSKVLEKPSQVGNLESNSSGARSKNSSLETKSSFDDVSLNAENREGKTSEQKDAYEKDSIEASNSPNKEQPKQQQQQQQQHSKNLPRQKPQVSFSRKLVNLYQKCKLAHQTIVSADEMGILPNDITDLGPSLSTSSGGHAGIVKGGLLSPNPGIYPGLPSRTTNLPASVISSKHSMPPPPPNLPSLASSVSSGGMRSRNVSLGSSTSGNGAGSGAHWPINTSFQRKPSSDGSAGGRKSVLQRSNSDMSENTSTSGNSERRSSVEPPPAVLNFLKALNSGRGSSASANSDNSTTKTLEETLATSQTSSTTSMLESSSKSSPKGYNPNKKRKSNTPGPPPPPPSFPHPAQKRPSGSKPPPPSAPPKPPPPKPPAATESLSATARKRARSISSGGDDVHQRKTRSETRESNLKNETMLTGPDPKPTSTTTTMKGPKKQQEKPSHDDAGSSPKQTEQRATRSSKRVSSRNVNEGNDQCDANNQRMYDVGESVMVFWEGQHYEAIVKDISFGNEEGDNGTNLSYEVEFDNGEIYRGINPKDMQEYDDV